MTKSKKSLLYLFGLLLLLFFNGVTFAQYTVTGTVTDATTGETLPGVNIYDEASGTGTTTDVNGDYTIELPNGPATLRFSFVGYRTQNIDVSAQTGTLNVSLRLDVANLEEVVVTGLATSIKRANLAHAVSSIQAEDISENTDPQTLDNALYGKVAGVNIISQSGAPGGGFNVQLRGISTLGAGNSQPLYIIDGVWVNNQPITNGRSIVTQATNTNDTAQDDVANRVADLNPEDIESVEILKGASAAAIYGQRANAGVIIIKTKSGTTGRTNVSVQQDVGFSSALRFLGRTDWNEERIRAFWGSGARGDLEIQRFNDAQNADRIRDLEKELYGEKGLITTTQIKVSGGNEKTRFFVSGNVKEEDGIIKNTGFDRKSIRANLEHRISSKVNIRSNTTYTRTENDRGFTGNQNATGGSLGYTLSFTPNYAYNILVNPDGSYNDNPYFGENPLRLRDVAENSQKINRLIEAITVDAELFEKGVSSLGLNINGGFDIMNANSVIHFPGFMQFQRTATNPGEVIHRTTDINQTNLQATLVFNTSVSSGIGTFDLASQLGYSRFTREQEVETLRGLGLAPGQKNVQNANVQLLLQNLQDVTDVGFFGQQEINFEDKLIGTFGGRFDRSTLNLDQDKYYFYPKASLALNITELDFWNYDQFSQLKLRVAYGQTGGLPNFGATFTPLNSVTIGGNLGAVQGTTTVDPSLEPERAKEIEAGLDFSLFDGRVGFEGTYYNKKVEDLILNLIPSNSTGIATVATNAADLENKGVELGVNFAPIRTSKINWVSNILWWTNTSEITKLTIPEQFVQAFAAPVLGGVFVREGESPTAIGGQDESGNLVKFGDFQPDFQMSWSNDFKLFQNWELSFLWHWSSGNENIQLSNLLRDSGGNTDDFFIGNSDDIVDRGPFVTSRFVEDASYLKLREASLYYNIPLSFLQRIGGDIVRGASLGVSGSNLLIISDYDGYDPEVSNFGTQAILQSVSVTPYPSARRIMFHAKIDL